MNTRSHLVRFISPVSDDTLGALFGAEQVDEVVFVQGINLICFRT